MKMMKGLLVAAVALTMTSVAAAAPDNNTALLQATLTNSQTLGMEEYVEYCSRNPSQCICFGPFSCIPK